MPNRHRLVMKKGPQTGVSFELASPLVSIGRYSGNTIIVADEQISRHHARLKRTDQGYSIEDLASANGLFVNDQRVAEARMLRPGDKIRLGQAIVFVYETFTEYDAIPAFAGFDPAPSGRSEPGPVRQQVSDKGETVFIKAADLPPGRVELTKPQRGGIPWQWIGVGIALAIVIVVAVVILSSSH